MPPNGQTQRTLRIVYNHGQDENLDTFDWAHTTLLSQEEADRIANAYVNAGGEHITAEQIERAARLANEYNEPIGHIDGQDLIEEHDWTTGETRYVLRGNTYTGTITAEGGNATTLRRGGIVDYDPVHMNFDRAEPKVTLPIFITQEDLDKFARKIYQIITEHTHINITEDEYMAILREEG